MRQFSQKLFFLSPFCQFLLTVCVYDKKREKHGEEHRRTHLSVSSVYVYNGLYALKLTLSLRLHYCMLH